MEHGPTVFEGPRGEPSVHWVPVAIAHDAESADRWRKGLIDAQINAIVEIEAARRLGSPTRPGGSLFQYTVAVPEADVARSREIVEVIRTSRPPAREHEMLNLRPIMRGAFFVAVAAASVAMLVRGSVQ